MRKLVTRIMLTVIISIMVVFIPSMLITYTQTQNIVRDLSVKYLENEVSSQSIVFNQFITRIRTSVQAVEGLTLEYLSDEAIRDDDIFSEYRDGVIRMYSSVAGALNPAPLSVYSWFDPDVLVRSRTISMSRKDSGKYTLENEYDYTWDDIRNEDWDWFYKPKENGENWTAPYFWEAFNTVLVSYSKALEYKGEFVGIVGVDTAFQDIKELVGNMKLLETGYFFLLDADGLVLLHPSFEGDNMADYLPEQTKMILNDTSGKGSIFYNFQGSDKVLSYQKLENGWIFVGAPPVSEVNAALNQLRNTMLIIIICSLIFVFIFSYITGRSLASPIISINEKLILVASGNLTIQMEPKLITRKDEIGTLAGSLLSMAEKLTEVVSHVNSAASNVSSGSQQLSFSSNEMSQGATEQAANAEEVSSSLEEMGASIQQNAESAAQTEKIAVKTAKDAADGGAVVNEAVEAMKEIANKINVIEEIARNTNLLSLNAAIEAARAGEHGKGFAVVASEVGKLAASSQKSAAEISELAQTSVSKADEAGIKIQAIVPDIQKTAELISEINASSAEMNSGIGQINQAMVQLDQIIQQNAAAAEESSSMSEELTAQAHELIELVNYFKIDSVESDADLEEV